MDLDTKEPEKEAKAHAPSLAAALMLARGELKGRVFKGGNNSAQGYRYVGHEQTLMACRDVLLDNDLLFEQVDVSFVQNLEKEKGSVWLWRAKFDLEHWPTNQRRGYVHVGTTIANDKAAYVASTSIERVALLRLLHLAGSSDDEAKDPFVEDAESDHSPAQREALGTNRSPDMAADATVDARSKAALNAALGALDRVKDFPGLVTWFRNLDETKSINQADRTAANLAFEKLCQVNNVNQAQVIKEARAR